MGNVTRLWYSLVGLFGTTAYKLLYDCYLDTGMFVRVRFHVLGGLSRNYIQRAAVASSSCLSGDCRLNSNTTTTATTAASWRKSYFLRQQIPHQFNLCGVPSHLIYLR